MSTNTTIVRTPAAAARGSAQGGRAAQNDEYARSVSAGWASGAFDAGAPAVMKAAGVATATTCVPGLVKPGDRDTRFFLPRFLDGGDVSMIEFEAEMSGVLQLLRTLTRRADLTAHALHPSPT